MALKYFKKFATKTEYDTYINGSPILPNVSFVDVNVYYKDNNSPTHDYSQDYLTFVLLENGTTESEFRIDANVVYSKDNGQNWETILSLVDLHAGDKILVKGSGYEQPCSIITHINFRFNVEGNVMSLIYGDDFIGKTSFPEDNSPKYLFLSCTGLTSAENLILPATTLADSCYEYMFQGCTNLVTAPKLPATTLANNCYYYMFDGCTSLVTAPELPATTLANSCYQCMFRGCSSLNHIKCLATDISADSCTHYWVQDVASTGTFVKNASMTGWSTGVSGIPTGWTVQDDILN